MKRTFLLLFCLLLACGYGYSQSKDKRLKARKLSKDEKASMTQEQVLSHENDRLTKGGKKKMSTKQKARVQRKQARAARHTKGAPGSARPKPKD